MTDFGWDYPPGVKNGDVDYRSDEQRTEITMRLREHAAPCPVHGPRLVADNDIVTEDGHDLVLRCCARVQIYEDPRTGELEYDTCGEELARWGCPCADCRPEEDDA